MPSAHSRRRASLVHTCTGPRYGLAAASTIRGPCSCVGMPQPRTRHPSTVTHTRTWRYGTEHPRGTRHGQSRRSECPGMPAVRMPCQSNPVSSGSAPTLGHTRHARNRHTHRRAQTLEDRVGSDGRRSRHPSTPTSICMHRQRTHRGLSSASGMPVSRSAPLSTLDRTCKSRRLVRRQ